MMGMIKGLMWGIFNIWSFVQNMIWPVTVVIVVVIMCRFFVKRISKQACYCLWLVVAIRLICPVTIESELSVFNLVKKPNFMTTVENGHQVSVENQQAEEIENSFLTPPSISLEGDEQVDLSENEKNEAEVQKEELAGTGISEEKLVNTGTNYDSVQNTMQISDKVKCAIWLIGIFFMFLYGVVSYGMLKYKLRFATKNEKGYFESEIIVSPFVLGLVKPVIYMPCRLMEEEQNYILLHEKYHIKRRDYLVKLAAFGLLCVYWFHPFVWLAFYLLSPDMETSCDEQVLKNLTIMERKTYSTLLLSFAARKRFPLPAPLSFGENNVKSRIKQILNYKKPTTKALVLVVGLIILVAVICLTDASDGALQDSNRHDEIAIDSENKIDSKTGRITDEYLTQLSEKLYEAKNPYIGNASGNGKVIKYLIEALDITGTNGMELQTSQEPYWLTLGFDKKPDDEKMFQLATMFLALVDNASEFRWKFPHETTGDVCVYYVNTTLVNKLLADSPDYSIKKLTDTPENIAALWRSLEELIEQYETTTGRSALVGESKWEYYAQAFGFDFTETNKWENLFIKDNLIYNRTDNAPFSIREITSCIYEDFDENGQKDMAVLISGYFGDEYGSRLYFYMNGAKQYSYSGGFMNQCFDMEIQSSDIGDDGATEIVFIGQTTGVGGIVGNYCKDIFKYKDGEFWDITRPGDYVEHNKQFPDMKEMGYDLEVYWGEEMDTYDIYCPTLNVTKTIYSPYLRDEKGKLYSTPQPGVLVGGNDGGFHTLKITEIDGKDYLVGTEMVIGEGGTLHSLANARFVLTWNEEDSWVIVGYDILPLNYEDDSDAIFEAMKQSLKYMPEELEEIIDESIPVVNYKKNETIEAYDQLSNFARCGYKDYDEDITYVIWNENEEPIYVRMLLKDGIYYYLEDDTYLTKKTQGISDYGYATYTNEIYKVQKNKNGEYIEYFYITNEENLTLEALQESMLSSAVPDSYDVMPIYHKKLDEEGFLRYMRTTGDILDLGIRIQLPEDPHWIQQPKYSVLKEDAYEKPLAKVEYYDGNIFTDMTLLVGAKEDVLKNTDITAYIDRFAPESWGASTVSGDYLSIDFYVMPIDDIYKMAAAIWEYEENTYVLYGKTAAGDCSLVAKVAAYMIGYLE